MTIGKIAIFLRRSCNLFTKFNEIRTSIELLDRANRKERFHEILVWPAIHEFSIEAFSRIHTIFNNNLN